jgi:hypothetical protein
VLTPGAAERRRSFSGSTANAFKHSLPPPPAEISANSASLVPGSLRSARPKFSPIIAAAPSQIELIGVYLCVASSGNWRF